MYLQICVPMRNSPPDAELGLQMSPTAAAAWHVLGVLLSHGRPTEPLDLASSCCKTFRLTPEFIRFLCSIPNSPLRIAEDHYVTLSRIGGAAIARFVANSDVIPRYLSLTQLVPRMLSNCRTYDIVWTYCRKRKRSVSTVEHFPPMKKRSHSHGCDEEQNLNQMLMTMPVDVQNAHTQGSDTLSSLSSPLTYGCWEPKSMIFGSTMCSNLHSGQFTYEIENIKYTYNMTEGACLSMDGVGYLHEEGCKPGFLFQRSFSHLQRPIVAEETLNSFPHTKSLLLEHAMVNSKGRSTGNIDVVNIVNSDSICTSPALEVNKMNISPAVDKTAVQVSGSLNEDDNRKRKEILLHDVGRCRGHEESHPSKTIYKGAADTDPEMTVSELNNLGLLAAMPGKVHLQSQGDILNPFTRSTSISTPDHQNEITDRKKVILLTMEARNSLPDKRLEQVTRDKDRTYKQKAQCNSDQNSNAKERETSIEKRKRHHNEQKPFPKFELFIVEEEEGSGGYGTVYRARRKADGVPFAIKCPHANANLYYVHNELKMLERLGGKDFVIKYEGSLKSGSNDCLVLEHVEHDRPEILKREIIINQLQWYGYCLFKALAGLHKQGIVHRDVKPGNFLFSRKVNKGYLIDFNLALDMSKKRGTIANSSKARYNQNDQTPNFQTKSLPPERSKKSMNARLPDAVNKNAGKVSQSVLLPVDLKKRFGKATVVTDTSSKNSIKSHGAEVSGITSARDVTSTRTPSAERLKGPLPGNIRKELLSLVQEAMRGENHKSANTPTSKRKRVAAPPVDSASRHFYPTPMPLYVNGLAIDTSGSLKGKADGKRKRDGPCAGTKGFKAPEVLFRSLHQGLKTDIWSAGVTLLYLMIGRTPFVGDTDQNIKEIAKLRGSEDLWEVAKIHDHESSFPADLLDIKYLSPVKLQDWCAHNTRRPDFLEAIPRSLYDLVDKCLTVNPRQRISAEEALRHEFFAPCIVALKKQRQQDKVHS